MSIFIGSLLSVDGVVSLLAVAGVWFWCCPRSPALRRYVLTLAIFYAFVSTPVVPMTAGRLWTAGFHQFAATDVPSGGETALVLLGGSDQVVVGWTDRWSIATPEVTNRVLEAMRVFQLANPRWVISSGGASSDATEGRVAGGIAMRDELVKRGVPAGRVLVEASSGSTRDQAVTIGAQLRSLQVRHVILVTSASHMRRAAGAFKDEGWTVVPAMAPFRVPVRQVDRVRPTEWGLSQELAHEFVGVPYYFWRGWWQP